MSIVLRGLMAMLLVAAVASCGSTNLGLEETPTRGVSDKWRGQPGHHPNGHDPSFWNTKDDKGTSSYLPNGKAPGQFPPGLPSNEKIADGKKHPGKGTSSYLSNGKAPGQFPNGLDNNEKIDHGKKLSGHGATAH